MGENVKAKSNFWFVLLLMVNTILILISYSYRMAGRLSVDVNLQDLYREIDDVIADMPGNMDTGETESSGAAAVAPGTTVVDKHLFNGTYEAIKRFNLAKLTVPSLYGGTDTISAKIGSFRGVPCTGTERHIFSKKRNVSFSFDPSSMACLTCPSKHPIVGGGGW
jgi:hypothetical protein